MKPGTKIKFHGGWDGTKDRCPFCKFSCAYIWSGVIVEEYSVWDLNSQTALVQPNLWVLQLETGAFTVGFVDQIELDVSIVP